jgi:hypothetical protein
LITQLPPTTGRLSCGNDRIRGNARPRRVLEHPRGVADLREQIDMTQRSCAIDACANMATRRGWCNMHYARWLKHGDPEKVISKTRGGCSFSTCERFTTAHGLCDAHNRQRAEGKELTPIQARRSHRERDGQGRKLCSVCLGWLHEAEFGKNGRYADGLSYMCRKCNTDKHRLANYGMTWEQYQELLAAQGGGCAICGRQCTSGRLLAVDHDHACCPGQYSCGNCVRGLLCGACNHGIGKFEDSPERLETAAVYLRRHASD